ncbi:MAG: hypothetical protein AAGD25_10340 [Cyanobacteria bacterium P01_F01_bin.150]
MFRTILKIALLAQAFFCTGPAALILALGSMFAISVGIAVPALYLFSFLTGQPLAEDLLAQHGMMIGKIFLPWSFGVLAIGNVWYLLLLTLMGKKLIYTTFFIISIIGGTATALIFCIPPTNITFNSMLLAGFPLLFGYQLLFMQHRGWYRYFAD